MSWAKHLIKTLSEGKEVSFRPKGNSMQPRIESGQLVTLTPITSESTIDKDDVVLCKCNGSFWLHLVSAIDKDGRYQISNNKGYINGWTTRDKIYGKLISVDK